jgi:translocator protein
MGELASSLQLRAGTVRWALVLVPLILLLGFLSSEIAGSGPGNPWFAALAKPAIYPPPQLFGLAWTLFYVLMGIALAIICNARGARGRGLAIWAFVIQFLLNLAWSPVFFAMHQIRWALYVLIALDVMVLVTLVLFWRIRPLAGMLLLPYLAWVLFATVLNYEFRNLNPGADGLVYTGAATRVEF